MTKRRIQLPTETLATAASFDPESYVLSDKLSRAVEVALALQQPLVLTGAPGTGKTRLAWRIAHDLHLADASFRSEPWVFNTKTTSTAQDLFYEYDAIRHYHDASVGRADGQRTTAHAREYIELRALGAAIAQTAPESAGKYADGKPQSSVVLIDEVDKAPRDFPNDLLAEIETYAFSIKEDANRRIKKSDDHRIVVILTSNSEKNLPEAFLRRCVFFHIPFPDGGQLLEIVRSQLGEHSAYADENLIAHFRQLRLVVRKKVPATAELISWLRILELHHFLEGTMDFDKLNDTQRKILRMSYSVLAKDREDMEAIETRFLGK